MKKFILPAFVVVAGAGAAFASDYNKKNEKSFAIVPGYIYSSLMETCIPIRECATTGTITCTILDIVNGTPVTDLNTPNNFEECTVKLYKP